MDNDGVKFWNSIVSRFGLFFIGLIVFAILVSGYLVYTESSSVISEYSKESIKHTSSLASQSFYALLDEVANDIAVIAENPVLENFVESPTPNNTQNLYNLFSVTLKNKPAYFQIRLIGLEDNGKEIVRFDKVNNEITQMPEDKLQSKGDKSYFKEAVNIKHGEFYFSAIDLNEEYGVVSMPPTPTLRAASSVFNGAGAMMGIVIINVDLSGFYQNLNQLMQSNIKLLIVDPNDQYLFATDMAKCFGKQMVNKESLRNDFNKGISDIIPIKNEFDQLTDRSGLKYLYHVEPLSYFQGNRKIFLVSLIEESLVLQSAYMVRNNSLKTVIIVCIIALIFAFLFTRIFSKRITQVTMAISNYDEENPGSKAYLLSEKRKDEIGILSRTFSKMRTKIDQQMGDLRVALNKEQKAIKERDEFLQNMSHELRTPLNAILGLTQLLNKNNPSKEQEPIIQSLGRSANNLAGLMYDILDHQKLVEGKVTIKYCPVNFSELLNDIHASYQFDAINKGIQFKLVMDKVLQTTKFHSDPLRFTQIITNLVVNSLKYTHKGAILLEGNTKDNMLQIIVKDTGIGILPNDLQKIKNRFYQVNEDNGVSKGSYGLGLSIVKQLVDLFNGRLEVTSKIDLGSSFKVSLPLIPAKETMNTIQSVSAVKLPSLNEKYTIIHLEDDEPAKQMVSEILNDKHFHLIQTSGIEQTMARMAENSFDLIISDLMIDSQVIEQSLIDIQVKITPIPLIVLSAFEKDKMENISPYYIQKPYTIDELLDLVFTLLGKNEYDEPKLEKAYQQYDHDATKILKFLDILIKEFNNYIDRVEKAYKEKSADQWSAIMHKLITHIKSMELTGLHQLMPVNVENLTAGGYEKVINSLRYLVCFFRTQRKLIAAD